MKHEAPEQEQVGLTPRQRLDCVNVMIAMTNFSEKYNELNAEERDEFGLLQDAAMVATEPNVAQHYFDQMKKFFIEKLGYEENLFKDENLMQLTYQFNNLMAADEERNQIAEKMIPDVERRIHELNRKGTDLRGVEPRTAEIKKEIQAVMDELKKLRDKREEVINAVYKTRHKTSVN